MTKLRVILTLGFLVAFTTIQAQWNQVGADLDGESSQDWSGYAVSTNSDGSIVAIGAYNNDGNGSNAGHVRIYQNSDGTWAQIGEDIDGEAEFDNSGCSVSLSSDGSIVAIGANGNDGNGSSAGHVRIYQNSGGTWTQIGEDIDGEAEGDQSGYSVSLSSDGSMVAIGAPYNGGNGVWAGHVRIYQNTSGTWTQVGADIDAESEGDYSGFSVSLSSDGSTVAVGAPYNQGSGYLAGHVRVFQYTDGTWTQMGADIDAEVAFDNCGTSVSLNSDGSTVAIGAPYNEGNGYWAGHVRIFQNTGGTWTQVGSDIDGEAEDDKSGYAVSLSDDGATVAIGAYYNDGSSFESGHVRIYENSGGIWVQVGADIDGEAEYDESGYSVCLSDDGSTVAIGAFFNDGNGTNAGHVRVYENVYVGVKKLQQHGISIYPNPTKDKLYLTCDNISAYQVIILNSIGHQISNELISNDKYVFDMKELINGIYFIVILDKNRNVLLSEKIIKE